ncbi:MAG: divergent polysaccharide deacetylase family protein [Thermodesulfobacteriota bacterium]|nr:divergent polysaccharide deacetylase family protein [Thermodesulfobacteriota bacterium]
MIGKKREGSGKKIKTPIVFILLVLFVFLAFVIFFGFLFSSDTARMPLPVFEEIYSVTGDLHENIRKIDYSIYESLYRKGTQESDILFLGVHPRHEGGHAWDFTELLVECPDDHSALSLQKIIIRDLIALGPEIRHRNEETARSRIICHIFVRDFYTHKIILQYDLHRETATVFRPKIAIIIDDLGYDLDMASSFIKLDLPLSISVLPSAPFTDVIVKEANREGRELILHLPMEPRNYPHVDPGPGTLLLSMTDQSIRMVLDQDIAQIKGARGVNNHMGSSFTENRDKMLLVLRELQERNLFYVDSRTTSGAVGYELAREIGLSAARRNVFLDNDPVPGAIKIQMERLLSKARHSGTAIGIGHPHKETLEMLEEYVHRMKTEFQVVPVSELAS